MANTQEIIKVEAEEYFSNFLGQQPSDFERVSIYLFEDLLDYSCTADDRIMLEKEVTSDEA